MTVPYQTMSAPRSLIHTATGCEPGTDECDRITELLNQVEDDRAHAEAERIRTEAREYEAEAPSKDRHDGYMKTAAVLATAAESLDPYEMRDGNLVRKSDGKIIKYKEPDCG